MSRGPTRAVKLYAACAALNSCNLGFDIGVNTALGTLIQADLALSDGALELFMGSLNLFAMAGALLASVVSDRYGRRRGFALAAVRPSGAAVAGSRSRRCRRSG